MDLDWDLFKGIISRESGLLEIRPLEVVLEGKLVFQPEGFVRIFALLSCLVVEG